MPSRVVALKSFLDPINLLVMGAALAITFLPLGIASVVNRFDPQQSNPVAASDVVKVAPAAPDVKVASSP